MDPVDDTFGHLVACVTEALGEQAELHVELAKAEIARDVRTFVRAAAPLAIGLPLVGVGYLLSTVALALALTPWLGGPGSFVFLGLANLLGGGLAVKLAVSRLLSRHLLNATVAQEVEKSARGIVTALRPPGAREVSPVH